MRMLKIVAVSLGLTLASPGLAVAQEAFVAGAITAYDPGYDADGRIGQTATEAALALADAADSPVAA